MKYLLFVLLISGQALAEVPKKDRWNELNNLLKQELRILESAKKKGPDIKYRILELHSEKLKLIHEKNNREFMHKSKTVNVSKLKESFFAETRAYYAKTKEMGAKLMREYPNTNLRPQVLFALALNSRDYGKDNVTEKYLLESISLVKDPHSSLRHHSETALADFYYNEKRFQDAITYYQRVIKKTEDEWLTKHLYNLSWCYLKVREFDKAITTIQDSYFKSKEPTYVNIKDQVLENVGSFYVYAGRPMEGLEFYLENEKDPIPYLIPMSVKTSDKGHQKETEAILAAAQKIIDKNDWFQYQEELFHTYLDFYRHYNRFSDHEETSRQLVSYYKKAELEPKLKLKTELKDDAIEKMRSLAGFLQIKLSKDMKEDGGQYKNSEIEIVLSFFSHLIYLDPKRRVDYFYFRAETFYSVRRFKDAAPCYVEAVTEARKVKNEELARKSLNSLLALTGQEVLDKDENKKFLIFAYSEHVALWPRDEKSEQIYPKLFEIYREAFDDEKASVVLRSYNKHYPEHLVSQQTMMTKVLDQFIEKQNTVKLAHWIEEFKKGFLAFSKATIEKTEIVLGNILFVQYQEMAKKGDKLQAAKGFESIYVHKLYPDKVKYQSAFFAAMAYIELGETVKSYYWQELAWARMTEAEKLERREEQLKMAERMYRLQDFKTSFKLSNQLLEHFCAKKDATQNRFFEIAVMTALVEEMPKNAENTVTAFSKCLEKPETRDSALSQMYFHYEKHRDFYGLRLFVQRHPTVTFKTQFRASLQKWYWEEKNVNLRSHMLTEIKVQKHEDTNIWIQEIALFDKLKAEKELLKANVVWNKPVFNGEEYNKNLESYLVKLQSFRNKYQGLLESNQLDLAIMVTRDFAEVYQHVGSTIQGQQPKGMDAQTLKEFSAAMKGLASQFFTASKNYEKQLDKAIRQKETVTSGGRSIASVESVENPVHSFFTGLTMDKSRE